MVPRVRCGLLPACPGSAGFVFVVVASMDDRDLVFQDSNLVPGWRFAPAARTLGRFFKRCARTPGRFFHDVRSDAGTFFRDVRSDAGSLSMTAARTMSSFTPTTSGLP